MQWGPCLEVQGNPLCSAALRVLLRQAVVEGRQAAPLLVGPGARRVRLQLQGLPQAVMVPVVVGVQRQQLPAGQRTCASSYKMLYSGAECSCAAQLVRAESAAAAAVLPALQGDALRRLSHPSISGSPQQQPAITHMTTACRESMRLAMGLCGGSSQKPAS